MKTKFRNNGILHRIFATLLLLAAIQPAIGQEYVRTANIPLCDTSIVRSIGRDSVIIYNEIGYPSFMFVSNGMGLNVPIKFLNNLYVNDFEVRGKMIFFCGYTFENNVKKAAYGSFSLAMFNDTNLSYSVLDTLTELKKLDFYRFEDMAYFEEHLVMIGTRGKRSDALVHTIIAATIPAPPAPPFGINNYDIYFSTDESENFDDVAAIDNYVVVSTRREENNLPIIDFWQFEKPTTSLTSFLNSNIHHIRMGSPAAETPVILEHYGADNYAAVYKNDGYPRMTMLRFTAPYNININGSIDIDGDTTNTVIPIDIKYNNKAGVFDILARDGTHRDDPESSAIPMQIYHLTPNILSGANSNGIGTRYTDDVFRLWSIDPLKESLFFVSSGECNNIPYLFKYTYYAWNECPLPFEFLCIFGHPRIAKYESILPESLLFEERSLVSRTIPTWIPFSYKCKE